MEVTKSIMAMVMTPEQRLQFLDDYRTELAKKHVLSRQQQKLGLEIIDNRNKLAGLELLTGGLHNTVGSTTFTGVYREANTYLHDNYIHLSYPVDARDTARLFSNRMRDLRPYTDADMDKYSVQTVELIEAATYGDPDAASFWMWAIYDGNYKLMIDSEAEGLGFERKVK
jgi:hypothetical protein